MVQQQPMRSRRKFIHRETELSETQVQGRNWVDISASYRQWVERKILPWRKGEMRGLHIKVSPQRLRNTFIPSSSCLPWVPLVLPHLFSFHFTIKITLIVISSKYTCKKKMTPMFISAEFTLKKKLYRVLAWAGLHLLLSTWARCTFSPEPEVPLRSRRTKGASDKA